MTDDFGPIIEHDGSCIPVALGTAVWVQDAIGCAAEIIAEPPSNGGSTFIWSSLASCWYPRRIVRYRQKRSRASQHDRTRQGTGRPGAYARTGARMTDTNPERTLLPRRDSSGGRSSSPAPAATHQMVIV